MVWQLTTKQKIEVLKLTKKLLGPNGENWIQGTWFGHRVGPGPRRFKLVDGNQVPIDQDDEMNPNPLRRPQRSWERTTPGDADCWCVLGAMEEAAHQLGYKTRRAEGRTVGAATSLRDWVQRHKGKDWGVETLNDAASSFNEVKRALNARLRELRAEAKA